MRVRQVSEGKALRCLLTTVARWQVSQLQLHAGSTGLEKMTLPSQDSAEHEPMAFGDGTVERLTHYLFRYPAKFHPPVARALIERFTSTGQTVLDPFCGSGTLLVEARAMGRNAVGTDVDPVAVFVSRTKSKIPSVEPLRHVVQRLIDRLACIERADSEYERRKFDDLTERGFKSALSRYRLRIPQIPNINHWFRRYVIIDLARILQSIRLTRCDPDQRDILLLSFASIIRNSSNADPVPVSGLEVTAHMKRREAQGRLVNPFALYRRAIERALDAYEQFAAKAAKFRTTVRVLNADATQLDKYLRTTVDAVLTSPPYHNAVDYYRRHTLEMYWLGLVNDRQGRLDLLPRYIGRSRVPKTHPAVQAELNGYQTVARWEGLLRSHSNERADAFKHYMVSMRLCMCALAKRLSAGKPAVFIVGRSSWNGDQIPTVDLFRELGEEMFDVREVLWYPLRNRYMSYSRHNGASIDREYVLVLERR